MVAKNSTRGAVDGGAEGTRAAGTKNAAGRAAAGRAVGRKTAARTEVTGTGTAGTGETAGRTGPAERAAAGTAAEAAAGKPAPGGGKAGGKAAGKAVHEPAAAARAGAGKGTGGKSTAKKAVAAQAAEQTGATTVVAKKTPGTATAADSAVPKARIAAAADPGDLPVRPGEDPWTPEEVEEARTELLSEDERLRTEIATSEASVAGLMRDSGDGAGDDQADTGTKNITREHELALAANAREMLLQTERALDRLDTGTYGLCENCGNAIGKARMQAFPRATLCVECKQKQERRY
ncbi:TraR/DksA family transcriptional regulator [Streptomyces sp. NPDC047000]|uniref:TraR/DksA family transcriptional regulator n=1 Tax=Streptomyces sp. NPDC047000 TaxID=3155474 RepID=UPI0033D968A2